MQVIDLRQIHSRALEPLFEEETRRWREELRWDYRPSVDLIRKFIDARSLGGYAARENGHMAGYGFYVIEEHKGLIGGLFVAPEHAKGPLTETLLTEMLSALHSTPRLQRIEAQLMPFGCELDREFLSKYFHLHTRQFMLLPLDQAQLAGAPLSRGLRLDPWTDRAFDGAAQLIHMAYVNHVDGQINDQYGSHAGGLKFLRNIVLLPGCGQFLPSASFVIRPLNSTQPIAMVLTSTVAERVGHTTQICVMPGYQGHGIGRYLMEKSIDALRQQNFESLSLTVTSVNQHAVELYEHIGFRTVKKFAAGVWQA